MVENPPFWWRFLLVEDWKAATWFGNVLMDVRISGIYNLWTTLRDCPEFSKLLYRINAIQTGLFWVIWEWGWGGEGSSRGQYSREL